MCMKKFGVNTCYFGARKIYIFGDNSKTVYLGMPLVNNSQISSSYNILIPYKTTL